MLNKEVSDQRIVAEVIARCPDCGNVSCSHDTKKRNNPFTLRTVLLLLIAAVALFFIITNFKMTLIVIFWTLAALVALVILRKVLTFVLGIAVIIGAIYLIANLFMF